MELIIMYELKHLIDVIRYDRLVYIQEHKEIFDKIDVITELNNRIVTIKDGLIDEPNNMNLLVELEFCESEVKRINEEIDDFFVKNDALKFDQDNAKTLMDYSFNELNQYVDLLEKYDEFNVDESLVKAFKESLKNLEVNVNEYVNLKEKNLKK